MSEFYIDQLWLACSVLIICTIGFHVVMLWSFPSALITWKMVDYLWLIPSGVAIFLAITANHQALAKTEIEKSKENIARLHKNLAGHLQAAITQQCVIRNKTRTGFAVEECGRLKDLEKKYNDMIAGDQLIEPFLALPKNQNSSSKNFLIHVKNYENSRMKLAEDEAKLSPVDFSTVLKIVVPIIFSPLLALRLTKVTADVIVEKGKINPLLLADDGRPVLNNWSRKRANKNLADEEKSAKEKLIIVQKNRENKTRQLKEEQERLADILCEINVEIKRLERQNEGKTAA
jgi:hypothetical protein